MMYVVSMTPLRSPPKDPPKWISWFPTLSGLSNKLYPASAARDVVPSGAPRMLSAGTGPHSNGGDSPRKAATSTATPSITANTSNVSSSREVAQSSTSASSSTGNGGPSSTEHSALTIGKNRGVPDGIVISTTFPSPKNPARKTTPFGPSNGSSVTKGLSVVGIAKTAFHHSACNSP